MGRCNRAKVEAAMPGTTLQIAESAGIDQSSARRWTRTLRNEGACHVSGWKRTVGSGGMFKAIYSLGPGKDVACRLKPLTVAQYSQRYRDKLGKDDDAAEAYRAKSMARRWALKARTNGDPMVNFLFGRTNKQQQANQ